MISILLLIPWIIFGFKNPSRSFFGLNQTKKSLTLLLGIEIAFFLVLYLTLPEPTSKIAGLQSFHGIILCCTTRKELYQLG